MGLWPASTHQCTIYKFKLHFILPHIFLDISTIFLDYLHFVLGLCSPLGLPWSIYMWHGVVHRYARWIGGLSHLSSNFSCLCNLLQKVVICALLNTGFKGIQVVTYLTNCQTTKVMLTKVFPKSLSACTWINKVNSSSWIYSCSMTGTNITRVDSQWLNNGPNCSVPETQMTAPKLEFTFLIYFPPNSMSNHCHITLWHPDHLLYFFCGKTTAHAQRKCHNSSAYLPVLLPESPVTTTTPEPHCLFLNPNFVPVTLSPRYFSAPSYWSLEFIYNI